MNNEKTGKKSAEEPKATGKEDLEAIPALETGAEEPTEINPTNAACGDDKASAELEHESMPAAENEATSEQEEAEKLEEQTAIGGKTIAKDDDVSESSSPESSDAAARAAEDEQTKRLESPIFKELASPELPALVAENRARLQMQSPNRLFFYWSIKNNPYRTLRKALGGQAQNYRLVARLVNLRNDAEEIYPVEPEGSWWFDVEAGAAYRAEVGFYSSSRPFVRLIFSNTVETPRAAPSPNLDLSPDFAVSASEFAEALDASGYRQDAFDVVLAGNDAANADAATNAAFEQIAGNVFDPAKFAAAELRYVLYASATGASLEDLRASITPLLFDYLVNILEEQPGALDAENVLPVWESSFGTEHAEEMRMQHLSASVFGASLINFPKITGRGKPKLTPVSSLKVSG